jgi:Domain of unknown function (DUF6817)
VTGAGEQRIVEFLADHGAGALPHPGGSLLDHLRRTHGLLVSWGAPPELVLAGLCHAVYGTDGYPHALVAPTDRHVVAALAGAAAEAIVHRYGRCDRAVVHPQLGRRRPVAFRDRVTRVTTHVTGAALRSFAELTVANEIDVLTHHAGLAPPERAALADLLTRCRTLVSPAAAAAVAAAVAD